MKKERQIWQCGHLVAAALISLLLLGCDEQQNAHKEAAGPKKQAEARRPHALSSEPRSILELPDDLRKPAVAWIEPERPGTTDSLSLKDLKKLTAWFEKKQAVMKPNEVIVVWKDITHYTPPSAKVHVYQPDYFSGKAVRGGPNQALTDGKLTVTVTGAKKRPYMSFHGPQPKVPFQYEVVYTLENQGVAAVKVDHFETLFFEPSGVLAVRFKQRNLKRKGNIYSDTDEPFVYNPQSKAESSMSSRGDCKMLNNVCLHVFYANGTESMFVFYIPSDVIVDEMTQGQ